MGALLSSPYNRTVHWLDPRSAEGRAYVSGQLYSDMKSGRVRDAGKVHIRSSLAAHLHSLMEEHITGDELTYNEFRNCLRALKVQDVHHKVLFGKFDKDGNEMVNPKEFCEAVEGYVNGRHNYMLLQSVFNLFDQTHSGKVTEETLEDLQYVARKRPNRDEPPTVDQIGVMREVLKRNAGNQETCGGRILPFQVFLKHCSTHPAETLEPFLSHIIATMCLDMSHGDS
eukprot:TRINITY_DN25132_c0_g1_i1.p1 TRINITY_DN25132_c0_g1~~TRINITY_DN25132_c0_g1_i1.p1  ORF type:complete len:252 (+),score=76.49 TRINITY_DN25132_c0_g1_i1:76-756(+)